MALEMNEWIIATIILEAPPDTDLILALLAILRTESYSVDVRKSWQAKKIITVRVCCNLH